ncbi:MAG: metal-dependent transcriptional regulator [Ignavibacteria bacterium]|nr:metal-dependent transcriptional regulator [Ignavibacteria bacterium]
MPSEQVENYLKAIYKLAEHERRVTTSLLSEQLRVSSPSVTEMIKKLSDAGVVGYTPYKGVQLTARGRKKALRIVRRHRLWELFLVEVLKYRWDEIDEEAERLEHITSDRLEERLDAFLGYPKVDPHGDVIPTAAGSIDQPEYSLLADCRPGTKAVVARVSDTDSEVLQHLSRLGIKLKKQIVVRDRLAFDGSMTIAVDGKEQYLSRKLASQIYIEHT